MNKLVLGNLLHRPLRTIIGIFAVAVEVIMILSIVGIFVGQVEHSKDQTSGIGADLIVRPPNASFISGVGGAPVPAKLCGTEYQGRPCQAASRCRRHAGHSGLQPRRLARTHLGHRLRQLQRAQALRIS